MKPFFLILISFFLLSFDWNKHKNDLEKVHLKGSVRSVIEISDNQKNILKGIYRYDSLGNLMEEITSSSGYDSALISYRERYSYNNKNRLLSYKTTYLGQLTNDSCKYNSEGRLAYTASYDSVGNLTSKDSSFYDSKGNVIKIVRYDMQLTSYKTIGQ